MEAPAKQRDDKGIRGDEAGQNRQDESNKVGAEGKRVDESKSLERFSSFELCEIAEMEMVNMSAKLSAHSTHTPAQMHGIEANAR